MKAEEVGGLLVVSSLSLFTTISGNSHVQRRSRYSINCQNFPDFACRAGGTCIIVFSAKKEYLRWSCKCPFSLGGKICQGSNVCLSHPCLNRGDCRLRDVFDGENYLDVNYKCQCYGGATGKHCESIAADKDPCQSSPCGENATCVSFISTSRRRGEKKKTIRPVYRCVYTEDERRHGDTQAQRLVRYCQPSTNNQAKNNQVNIISEAIDPSSPAPTQPCLNDGACVIMGQDVWMCEWPPFTTGFYCETQLAADQLDNTDEMRTLPPLPGEEHLIDATDDTLQSGFRKRSTSRQVWNPCKFGGVCKQSGSSYECFCPKGTSGRNCSIGCPGGRYGFKCGKSCGQCADEACHYKTGTCKTGCHPGWRGAGCRTLEGLAISMSTKLTGDFKKEYSTSMSLDYQRLKHNFVDWIEPLCKEVLKYHCSVYKVAFQRGSVLATYNVLFPDGTVNFLFRRKVISRSHWQMFSWIIWRGFQGKPTTSFRQASM